MAEDVVVPGLGESVTQAVLIKWHKEDGQAVAQDEPLCELETDKANVDVPAPKAGIVKRVKNEGDTVAVGEVIASIDANGKAAPAAPKAEQPKAAAKAAAPAASEGSKAVSTIVDDLSPAVRRMIEEHQIDPSKINGSGPGRRITKEDVQKYVETGSTRVSQPSSGPRGTTTESHVPAAPTAKPAATVDYDANGIRREPMSKIRKRIAERLVSAQQTAAILTTFNEIDMTAVFDLRTRYKERFSEVHGVNLGLMSFFVRATVLALKEFKAVNASIEGDDVVYHNYVHMGIAVSSERGLAVPVLRNVQDMSFARIEAEIKRVAIATREGKLGLDELSGGTFTITNGGVFGSLLSTPIINPPQSGILGMHAVQKRAMVIGDKIEIRPMMYVALSYDHRLVDGRESVSFLVRLKQFVEDPARLMLEI